MKIFLKILSLLLILYSFSASSEIEYRELMADGLDMSLSDFCIYQPGIQNRGEIGNWKLFFPNEEKGITATSICVYKDEYGQISEKGELVNGLKEGSWINYYRNGQKKYIQNYKNGIEDGSFVDWTENGQKTNEMNYKEGVLDGDFLGWYPSGQIRKESYVNNSNLDGIVTLWQLNGDKWFQAVFKNGERIGNCEIHNDWDLEKLAIEKSPNYAVEIKRYTEGEYRRYCK